MVSVCTTSIPLFALTVRGVLLRSATTFPSASVTTARTSTERLEPWLLKILAVTSTVADEAVTFR